MGEWIKNPDGLVGFGLSPSLELYGDKQQLIPISVVETPLRELSWDLLDAAYSPALLTQLLAKSEDNAVAAEDDYYGSGSYRTSPDKCRADESAAAYWESGTRT